MQLGKDLLLKIRWFKVTAMLEMQRAHLIFQCMKLVLKLSYSFGWSILVRCKLQRGVVWLSLHRYRESLIYARMKRLQLVLHSLWILFLSIRVWLKEFHQSWDVNDFLFLLCKATLHRFHVVCKALHLETGRRNSFELDFKETHVSIAIRVLKVSKLRVAWRSISVSLHHGGTSISNLCLINS